MILGCMTLIQLLHTMPATANPNKNLPTKSGFCWVGMPQALSAGHHFFYENLVAMPAVHLFTGFVIIGTLNLQVSMDDYHRAIRLLICIFA